MVSDELHANKSNVINKITNDGLIDLVFKTPSYKAFYNKYIIKKIGWIPNWKVNLQAEPLNV